MVWYYSAARTRSAGCTMVLWVHGKTRRMWQGVGGVACCIAMCCNVSHQSVAACCQCVAACYSSVLQRAAPVCCNMLHQCVAMCCTSALQRFALVCCSVSHQCVAACCTSALQHVAPVCCSILHQCIAAYCTSVLQHIAAVTVLPAQLDIAHSHIWHD